MKNIIYDTNFWINFDIEYKKIIFNAIYKTYSRYSFNVINEDIEDIYHNFFIKILKDDLKVLKKYNSDKSKLSTYFHVIVSSVTIDYLKKKKDKQLDENKLINSTYENIDKDIDLDIPKNILTKQEEVVIRLIFVNEFSSIEIGSFLKISDSTVRVIKKNALRKLKLYLEKDIK